MRLPKHLSRRRLKIVVMTLWIAIITPSVILIWQTYRQLRWEVYYQYQNLAIELAERIDEQLNQALIRENTRRADAYQYLIKAENQERLSELSHWPPQSDLPGVLGYFQIDEQDVFSTPWIPVDGYTSAAFNLSPAERVTRKKASDRLFSVLSDSTRTESDSAVSRAVKSEDTGAGINESIGAEEAAYLEDTKSAEARESASRESVSQLDFDQLADRKQKITKRKILSKLGNLSDLNVSRELSRQSKESSQGLRSKQIDAPLASASVAPASERVDDYSRPPTPLRSFFSKVEPFKLKILTNGHFVIHRNAWQEQQRFIQGMVINQQAFVNNVEKEFRRSRLLEMSNLVLAFQGEVLALAGGIESRSYRSSNAAELSGLLLYQTKLSPPFSDIELLWTINRLPTGPGFRVLAWTGSILFFIVTLGLFAIYRLGCHQIGLFEQQRNFVSAVSHELKTPLTSIRMYGELLQNGWASEEKKPHYYRYIFEESERLSRLIGNVLQLARLERNNLELNIQTNEIQHLLEQLRTKVGQTAENAGFKVNFRFDSACLDQSIDVDPDAFMQIMINLIDNALKFSAQAEIKQLDIGLAITDERTLRWSVRDYGDGIPQDKMRDIFTLFYRAENELTRETIGTGIGLALVRQLADAMSARVDVVNVSPGAEFRVDFPSARAV